MPVDYRKRPNTAFPEKPGRSQLPQLRTFPPHNQCLQERPTVSNSRIKKSPCFAQPALAGNENRFHQNVRPLSLKRPRIVPSLAQGLNSQALELQHAHPGQQINVAIRNRLRHNPQPFDWEVILCVVS